MDRAIVPLGVSVELLVAIHDLVASGVRAVEAILERLRPSSSSDGVVIREGVRALLELHLLLLEGDGALLCTAPSDEAVPFRTRLAVAVAEGAHPRWRPVFHALRHLIDEGSIVATNADVSRAIAVVDPLVRRAGLVRVRWWSRFCDQLGLGFHFVGAGLFLCRPSSSLRESVPPGSSLGRCFAAMPDDPAMVFESATKVRLPEEVQTGLCSIIRRFEDPRMLCPPLARESLGDVLEFGRGERVIPCAPDDLGRPVLPIEIAKIPPEVATALSLATHDLQEALHALPRPAEWLDQWRGAARDFRTAARVEFTKATGLSVDEFLWASATLLHLATNGIVPLAPQDRVSSPPAASVHPVFEERSFSCALKGARLMAAEANAFYGLAFGCFMPGAEMFNHSIAGGMANRVTTLELVRKVADVRLADRSLRKFRSVRSHRNLWILSRAVSEFAAGLLSIDVAASRAIVRDRIDRVVWQLRADSSGSEAEWREAMARLDQLRGRLGLPPICASVSTPRPLELAVARGQAEALTDVEPEGPIEVLDLATRVRAIEGNDSVRALQLLEEATEKTRSVLMRLRRPGGTAEQIEGTSVRVRLRERLVRLLSGRSRPSVVAKGAVA